MKKLATIILSFVLILSMCSCKKENTKIKKKLNQSALCTPSNEEFDIKKTDELTAFVNKVNSFSLKFTSKYLMKNSDKSVCVSPLSILFTLFLSVEIGSDEVRSEILNALDMTYDEIKENAYKIINLCNFETLNDSEEVTSILSLNNVLWLDRNYKTNDDTLETLAKYYQTFAYQVDFINNNKESNEMISQFVKEETRGLIDKKFDFKAEVFILMNTIYMKSLWSDEGTELNFMNGTYEFTSTDNQKKQVKLLNGTYNPGKAYEGDQFYAFHQSTNSNFDITFIKPKQGVNIYELINSDISKYLNITYLKVDYNLRENYLTRCLFPEFSGSTDESIKDFLSEEFKIKAIFKDNAFPRLIEEVLASDFFHTTKLIVNKKGIEGAAVTIVPSPTSAGGNLFKDVYADFIVDRDFFYIVTFNHYLLGSPVVIFSGICQNI